jgi:hypothetical protein
MNQLPTKQELLDVAKPLTVNLEVAETSKFHGKIDKPQTRRVISDWGSKVFVFVYEFEKMEYK